MLGPVPAHAAFDPGGEAVAVAGVGPLVGQPALRALGPAVHVDRDQPLRVGHARGGDRQRREQAAVDQLAAVHDRRREQARDRERCAQRLPQRAAAQPDHALAHQVDRDRDEGDRQAFDVRVADHFAHRRDQAMAVEQAAIAQRRIAEQAQERAAVQRLDAGAEFGELAGREHAADQRAAGTAGDRCDPQTARLDRLDHPDLRQPARAAGAQRQRHPVVARGAHPS